MERHANMPGGPTASLGHHSEIAFLVGLVRVGADEQKVHAAATLGILALERKENRDQIRQAGGISALVALARVGTSEQKLHASSALGTLGPETRCKTTSWRVLDWCDDWLRVRHAQQTLLATLIIALTVTLHVDLHGTVGNDAGVDESAKCADDYHRALLMYESVYDAEALGENTNGQFRHTTQTNVDGALECIPVGIYILTRLPICIKYRTLLHEIVHYNQCLTTHDKNRLLPIERMRSIHPMRPVRNYEPHVDSAMWDDVVKHYQPEQWDIELEARVLEKLDGIYAGTSLYLHLPKIIE